MSKKIILTRSVEDNQALAKQLLALNYSVIEFPAIKIVDHFNLNQKISLEDYDCLVFTSAKAIYATRRYLESLQVFIPKKTLIAVVGQASAKSFQECFRRSANIIAPKSNSESLADDLLQKLQPKQKVLFLAGNLTLDILPQKLVTGGMLVDTLQVYRNIIPQADPQALQEISQSEAGDLIFPFFSPSAVDNCIKLLSVNADCLQQAKIISIGAKTSARLLDYQLIATCELARPDQLLLVKAILDLG